MQISVIIPVYNAEKTLQDCVTSILVQNENCLEIILVDDGSKDSSPLLCDALEEANPGRVRVIHQKNAGSLAARMAGAAVATGEYLLYVDADDVLLEGAVAQIRENISGGAELYLYDYIMDSMGGQTANTVKIMDCFQMTEFSGDDKLAVNQAFMNGMMNTVCATAIRRSFMEGLEFCFPERKIRNGEDRLQKLQMLAAAKRIVYVPYAFYHYKWYPSTQGGDLRTGSFSAEIYEDFRLTWPIERAYYAALGFGKEQSRGYDQKKLTRICGLLENSWCQKRPSNDETGALICQLSSDTLFCQLSSAEILAGVRPHIRRSASMIRGNRVAVIKAYWWICHFVRRLRYGKSV